MKYHIKLVQFITCAYLCKKILKAMKFDNIDGNGRLWAVKYDEDDVNVLEILFRNWGDVDWLADFFI